LTACTRQETGRLPESNLPSTSPATASIANFPNPGPFKLVEVDDPRYGKMECWQARGQPGEFGGALRVSTFGSGPKTFNPWEASDVESAGLGLLLFEKLVDIDAWTGKPYPRLAKSIRIGSDNKEYTITLRKGLRWSDGKPITADDVVFTFGTIVARGYGNSSLRDTLSVYGKFPQVEKVDDSTVKFRTSVPFSPFLKMLPNVPIAPKHAVEPITKQAREKFHGFWDINADPKSMVVSGRFKLNRYVPGQRIELVRNPNYAMVDMLGRRLPYLDRFIYAIVPDQNTMILKFYGNELDLLDIRSVRGSDAALMKQKEQTGNFRMYNLGPDEGTTFFMVNMNRRTNPKTHKPYVDPVKQKWFNNKYFRQAISHAINRQRMIDNILRGVGIPLYTPETTASLYFNRHLKPYPQDLALAAQLLDQGGFRKKGNRLFDSDGHPVQFTLHTNAGNSARDAACVMIANELGKLGIKVNYQPIDFNILIDKTNQSMDWQAIVMGLSGSKIEPYDGANVWKSDGRLHMFDQRLPNEQGQVIVTDARDWEKRIDELFDLAATTFDEAKRHEYFDEWQQIAYDQLPFTYLYTILDITAARNTIGNYMPTPLGIFYTPLGSLHNLEEIYFKHPSSHSGAASRPRSGLSSEESRR
jgi:peptide/nickel transport system substrate-binding protein